ncbi:MAG TPA: glucose 1-dehydrogenase [Vicinamibacterales bacterium]|nr:glucose 1-dehydrogenase [Vicinamibacterales bacterium]
MDATDFARTFRLDNRVVAITGASRGIGRATALACAAAGADVAVLARDFAALQAVCHEIENTFPSRAVPVRLDISRSEDIGPAVDSVLQTLGRIDVLVNNAGMNIRQQSSETCSLDDWDTIFNTNARGTFAITQLAARDMATRQRGKIVNVGSVAALIGLPAVPAYSASKAAVQQLTRVLAVEWAARNIQVNAIAPGFVATEMTAGLWTDAALKARYDWVLSHTPQRRLGQPEEIAAAIVFLASAASNFITGHVLVADGGLVAGSEWRFDE